MPREVVRIRAADGRVVCARCRVADSFWPRLRGLLGHASLPAGEGLLIRGTSSVHTHLMRFPIDVVFVDADGRVVGLVGSLRPWRLAGRRGARDVLELAAGECGRLGLEEGDVLVEEPLD